VGTSAPRVWQAIAVAALGVPGILVAHLLATGRTTGPGTAAVVVATTLAVAAARPARTAAGLALVATSTQVVGHGVLALVTAGGSAPTGCIPMVGRGAAFGLHLALLRVDAGCPSGTLAPGPAAAPTAVALASVVAALTVVTGHALAAVATGVLLAIGGRAAGVAQAVGGVAAALAALAAPRRLLLAVHRLLVPPAGRPLPAVPTDGFVPTPQRRPVVLPLRGPPVRARRAGPRAPVGLPA
jgi:hypothetical protein